MASSIDGVSRDGGENARGASAAGDDDDARRGRGYAVERLDAERA